MDRDPPDLILLQELVQVDREQLKHEAEVRLALKHVEQPYDVARVEPP